MLLLVLFGLIAGAATALSPCVLPVLPIVLSGGVTGGRRRPLGIVLGLTATFTFATVALAYVISALGLPDTLVRTLAIVTLIGFGVVLMVPALAARVEGWASRMTARSGGTRAGGGDGLWSGVVLGAGLGLVYAPCAGPILAGVITTSASQSFTGGRLAIALAYGVGTGIVLYGLMLGGRRLTRPLSRRSGRFQIAMGLVMVVLGIGMLNNLDLRFQAAIASDLPSFLVDPSGAIERSDAAQKRLAELRGGSNRLQQAAAAATATGKPTGSRLPVLGTAPQLVGTQRWFNTPGGQPLKLSALRGHVVLLDFWTYTCINCLRTIPAIRTLSSRYRPDGLEVIGIHSPEFPFEKSAGNVEAAIGREQIHYPVVQDNDLATWNAYGNQYWPAQYLIDAQGRVRYTSFGEGQDDQTEQAVRSLLTEAGHPPHGRSGALGAIAPSTSTQTPESYLGASRADRIANGALRPGPIAFGAPPRDLPANEIAFSGRWQIGDDQATAIGGAGLALHFDARRVFLVLRASRPGALVDVRLDGRPIGARDAGSDVHGGQVRVDAQRLYTLVDLPRVGEHRLDLRLAPGVSAYAFTFG